MANEFRVKNGLIVDEVSSGAGVLSIIDGNITSDDGSIEVTVVDGQSVTIGKVGSHANIVVTPHGTAGSELITLLNTSGTDAAAIKLNAVAGGIDIDAAGGITLDGTGISLDSDAASNFITTGGALTLTSAAAATWSTAAGNLTLDSAAGSLVLDGHTGAQLISSNSGEVDITSAAAVDINATTTVSIDGTGISIDGTTISIDGTDDVNLTVTSSTAGEDLTIQQVGANDSSIHILAAGTGTDAIKIDATAGHMLIAPTLANAKTLKIGPVSATQMIFAPHGTAGSEKITLTNTAGTGSDAIKIESTAGGIALTTTSNGVTIDGGGLYLKEQSAAATSIGSFGQLWVDDSAPNALYFTTDAGDDIQLTNGANAGSASFSLSSELVMTSDAKISFHDAGGGENILASADGHLEINAGTTLDMTSPTIDINASTAVTFDTPSITITDVTASSATEGGFIRLVSDDGAAMANNHRLGVIEFAGAEDASNTITVGARIEAICDAGWSASENGAALVMYTTDANAAQSEVLRLDSDKLATFAGSVTILGDFNITGDINSTSVTNLDVDDLTITVAKGAANSSAADGAGIVVDGASASLLYDHTGTQWEFNKNVEFAGHILPGTDDTYDIGSAGAAWQDLFLEGDITLTDAGTLQTSAGGLTITAAEASTWSTSAGALTLTAAAASTWSTAAGALTLTSAAACTWSTTAGVLTIDGDDGVQISSTAAGNIDLDSFADIVLDTADDKHIIFQQATVPYMSIGQGTAAIAEIADSAGATAIDVFDCTVYQAVKYLILVEDVTSNDYMTAELLVLGDNIPSTAVAYMTIYAVIYNSTELGTFSATGSGDNITLKYDPTEIGSKNHKVRVVAQRISALS